MSGAPHFPFPNVQIPPRRESSRDNARRRGSVGWGMGDGGCGMRAGCVVGARMSRRRSTRGAETAFGEDAVEGWLATPGKLLLAGEVV